MRGEGGKIKHYVVPFLNLTYRQMAIYREYDHYRLYDDFCPSLRYTSSSLDTNQNIESQSGYGRDGSRRNLDNVLKSLIFKRYPLVILIGAQA